jgi:hypothetical protein
VKFFLDHDVPADVGRVLRLVERAGESGIAHNVNLA